MELKHIAGLLILVAVIFFGTVFMFVYKTSSPRPLTNNQQTASYVQNSASSSTQTSGSATTSTQSSGQNSFADNSVLDNADPYESDCVVQKKAAAVGKNYEKGSLLVTFEDVMDFETAVKTIELLNASLGVRVNDSLDARTNFRQNHWLEVTVSGSSEFQTQCELEKSEGVKRTSLNFLFSLRQ